MIRRILTIALVLAFSYQVNAQNSATNRYAEHSLLASGKWVKIRVSKEGVYQISKSKLAKMGFSNPDKVSLYGYNLPVLPEAKIENISDDITEIPLWRRSDGSVLFYSFGTVKWQPKSNGSSEFTRTNNTYSSYVYYFVTEKKDDNPSEMQTETTESTVSTVTTTFPEHIIIEKDELSLINSGRNFYESYDYSSNNKKSYTLETPGIANSKVVLTVQFVAGGLSTLSITADDTTFSSMSFSKLAEYEYGVLSSKTVNWNKTLNESSTITLTHTRGTGISGHLDYILANYTRKLDLSGINYLAFRPTTSSAMKYEISGANDNTHVWRVTSPKNTCEIGGTYADTKYTINTNSDTYVNEYVAVNTAASFSEPEVVGTIENQDLHALKNIDYVIIVPANGKLTAQAQILADAHTAKDSMRCVVLRADQIYNEFSSGTPDATAYRRFMKMLYDKAANNTDKPKNVCLFGDGVWDNRMVTSDLSKKVPDDYLLCYESENSLSHTDSYVLEEYYTLLADNKGISPLKEKPDCGVGRITVTTIGEARGVVNKLISYLNNKYAGSWKNTVCVMADDGNANVHMSDAEAVSTEMESLYPDYRLRKIYWDTYSREESGAGHTYNNAYLDITKQIENGALIMNYTGHGSAYILSHEQVLKRTDFESWTSPRIPLWFFAACDVTPFDMNEENIGETALLNENGAALATIGTTRTVYSAQNRKINLAFMKYVLAKNSIGRQYSIGEALSLAKSEIVSANSYAKRDSINKCHFILIGDPAIALTVPTYKVKIDTFNNKEVSQNPIDTIKAGAVVNVSGHIVDENGNTVTDFKGTVSQTVFDNKELVTCLNNAEEDVTPFQFYDRIRTIYSGTDSVRQGQFEFTFPVPLDINYSNETGLINLYAVNKEKTIEANGSYDSFAIGETDPNKSNNTTGPLLTIALNGVMFTNKNTSGTIESNVTLASTTVMNETPFFAGAIEDENGINTIGSGIGHEITLIVDNDPSMTYNLNSYFEYVTGSWTKGNVGYSIPVLSAGKHSLFFRAWDILNNPSTLEVQFNVQEGMAPTMFNLTIKGPVKDQLTLVIENDRPQTTLNVDVRLYDISGRELWQSEETNASNSTYYTYTCNLNATNGHLPPGIYICKATISTANGAKTSAYKKFLVVAQ